MAKMLTDKAVEKLKTDPTKRREIPDAGKPGLYLIVQPSGRKSWAVRYRHRGKTAKLTLDGFPSLATARKLAQAALDVIAEGGDPATQKRVAKADASDERFLVKTVIADFVDQYHRRKKQNRHAGWVEALFRKNVVPQWGDRHVATITRNDVEDLIGAIDESGKRVLANRVLTALRTFFTWCVKQRSIPVTVSPCASVDALYEEVPRERVLTDDEVRWLWQACAERGQPFAHVFKLLLLTGQRRSEVAGMTEGEIDGTDWVIPAARVKNKQDHIVPLSDAARDILADVKRVRGKAGLVFTTTGVKTVSGWSAVAAAVAKRMLELGRAETGDDAFEIERWTPHDLRRTAASGMARLRIRPHVIEAVLNHRSGVIRGIAAIYNRYDYHEEKQAALQAWANRVTEIVTGKEAPGNVVQIYCEGIMTDRAGDQKLGKRLTLKELDAMALEERKAAFSERWKARRHRRPQDDAKFARFLTHGGYAADLNEFVARRHRGGRPTTPVSIDAKRAACMEMFQQILLEEFGHTIPMTKCISFLRKGEPDPFSGTIFSGIRTDATIAKSISKGRKLLDWPPLRLRKN